MHAFLTSVLDLPDSPDTLKVTPDTSIGIEEVRQIQTFLSRKSLGSHNTVIIYAAEKLTLPAQHALLKTLEEPPGNSLIYLVTSYPDTLLPTILSRVQIISSPYTSNSSYASYIPQLISAGVGDRLKILDSQSFTRETALKFLDEIEYYIHASLNNSPLRPPLNLRGGSEGALCSLLTECRKFLKSNCNVKLVIDHLALNLDFRPIRE